MFVAIVAHWLCLHLSRLWLIDFVCIYRAGRRFYDLSPIPHLSAVPFRSESYRHNTGDHLP